MFPLLKSTFSYKIKLVFAIIVIAYSSSCNRQTLFTTNTPVAGNTTSSGRDSGEKVLEKALAPNDKIMISIWDHEELSIGSLQSVYSLAEENGKWVLINEEGETKLPQIGRVKLKDLTVAEAEDYLEKLYAKFIQNPVITIRVLNNQVTILGEVRTPGIYIFSNEKIRAVDVIAKAQGITDYGKAKKVTVIRGADKYVIDLSNSTSATASELMLEPGDVVYIPPTGGKAFDKLSNKIIPIASLITAIALVYSVTQK